MINHTDIKKEVSLKILIFIEVLKLLLGVVIAFCSFLFITSKISVVYIHSIVLPIRILLFIILTLIGFAIIFIGVYSIISILMLKISDSHIFESKSLFKVVKDYFVSTRTTGSLYQQHEGTIYKLVAPTCTLCDTTSKSSMRFIYEKKNKCYFMICSTDKNHKVAIDTKTKNK